MLVTVPWLTISVLSPLTCVRRVSSFCGAYDKRWTLEVCVNVV